MIVVSCKIEVSRLLKGDKESHDSSTFVSCDLFNNEVGFPFKHLD